MKNNSGIFIGDLLLIFEYLYS